MNARLTHVAMHVRDLDACVRFYSEICGMEVVHARGEGDDRVVWVAEPPRRDELVFVLISGGPGYKQRSDDYSHLGFALPSREAVDAMAARAREAGCLLWEPREDPHPVGYTSGLRDPDGRVVELSYGQPLGPGAPGR